MYRFKSELHYNDLVDGRTIQYLSEKVEYNRENLAKILKGEKTCSYDRAESIVKYCKPNKKVEDYFIKIKEEG